MTYVEKFHKTSKKIQVFETVRFVKMVQRGYEERFAISQHYKVRGTQPICIHPQSCHFVNKCCLAENLLTKNSLIFYSSFSIKNKKLLRKS